MVKSYKKSLSDPNNYRGISLIPILTKLLELLIIVKYPNITTQKNNQFGFKSQSSTMHAAFSVKETVNHYNDRNTTVFICSLDAEKAFDSCNWDILFSKLSAKRKLPQEIISVLQKLYSSGTSAILYENIKSYTFDLSQGVRQGSILSPHLYNIYTEDLLDEICALNVGTTVNGTYTGITAYADDIILMSSTISGLQKMINKCTSYGMSHMIKFNSVKTEFVMSGASHHINPFVYIDSLRIYPQSSLIHLGFHWSINNQNNKASFSISQVKNRIKEMWCAVNALITTGIRFCHPQTIFTLYKTIVIPKLLYGLELCQLNATTKLKLDRVARTALKYMFNVSKHSLNILSELANCSSISSLLDYNRLFKIVQLLKNSVTRTLFLRPDNTLWKELISTTTKHSINIYDVMLFPTKITRYLACMSSQRLSNTAQHVKSLFDSWSMFEVRQEFTTILEGHIPK